MPTWSSESVDLISTLSSAIEIGDEMIKSDRPVIAQIQIDPNSERLQLLEPFDENRPRIADSASGCYLISTALLAPISWFQRA